VKTKGTTANIALMGGDEIQGKYFVTPMHNEALLRWLPPPPFPCGLGCDLLRKMVGLRYVLQWNTIM